MINSSRCNEIHGSSVLSELFLPWILSVLLRYKALYRRFCIWIVYKIFPNFPSPNSILISFYRAGWSITSRKNLYQALRCFWRTGLPIIIYYWWSPVIYGLKTILYSPISMGVFSARSIILILFPLADLNWAWLLYFEACRQLILIYYRSIRIHVECYNLTGFATFHWNYKGGCVSIRMKIRVNEISFVLILLIFIGCIYLYFISLLYDTSRLLKYEAVLRSISWFPMVISMLNVESFFWSLPSFLENGRFLSNPLGSFW